MKIRLAKSIAVRCRKISKKLFFTNLHSRGSLLWFVCATVSLGCLESLVAVNPQDWMKKVGQQKRRGGSQRQTAVAAVRGVDEPSQVDSSARNYEAIKQMESRAISQEKLVKFINEGKLVARGADPDKE